MSNNSLEVEIKKDGFVFHLNHDKKTACIFGIYGNIRNIFIPRSITYQDQEFIITSILERSFESVSHIQSVEFSKDSEIQTIEEYAFNLSGVERVSLPSSITKICKGAFQDCIHLYFFKIPLDSKLQTIEKKAFYNSSIESLSIPSDILELQKGWCNSISNLKNIKIIQRNQENISYSENGIVVGKSDISSDIYDILLFVPRYIKSAKIPTNIKIIGSYSFDQSQIEEVIIPSSVTTICDGAFGFCVLLKKIEIQLDSKLQIIERKTFNCSAIESISIPSDILELQKE